MHLRNILTSLCCAGLCCSPVFAQAKKAGMSDKDFVMMAAETDMLEAHLGQMAQDQASRQDVKDYGQMLVSDHTANYKDASAVASKAGTDVPKAINAKDNKTIDQFVRLKGAAFDHRFLAEMIQGHQKAITEFKREAASGEDANVKAFANSTLPKLQDHLDKAKDLSKPAAKHAK